MVQKNGKTYYVFPDAAHNQAYVGGPKQYETYHQLRLKPWAEWWEKDIKAGNTRGPGRKLARYLMPFDIVSGPIRQSDVSTPRGYKLASFEDAFSRYLPWNPPFKTPQRHKPLFMRFRRPFENATNCFCGVMQIARKAFIYAAVFCGVLYRRQVKTIYIK